MSYKDIRKDYAKTNLNKEDTNADPLLQFKNWFDEAVNAKIEDVNAMCLATVGGNNRPSTRIVLLKEITHKGIVFFTNYKSRKGEEINLNPFASICFYWTELERQVRMEGALQKISREESVAYFDSRPLQSRISAIVSNQSQVISDKSILENKVNELEKTPDKVICPESWGGYELVIDRAEFWQGRPNRLHDRIMYSMNDKSIWEKCILAP
ncbi:MAG: pyridoxamine 5'-phosphate oxidase [Saprospiraceae bacterium]|nr:pyridoxamine 5'-phosphate oxidase [Saprospiraceae bacterium]